METQLGNRRVGLLGLSKPTVVRPEQLVEPSLIIRFRGLDQSGDRCSGVANSCCASAVWVAATSQLRTTPFIILAAPRKV